MGFEKIMACGDQVVKIYERKKKIDVSVDTSGYYKLYMRWDSRVDLSRMLKVIVMDSYKMTHTVWLDQNFNSNVWVFIGTYWLEPKNIGTIIIGAAERKPFLFTALKCVLSVKTDKRANIGYKGSEQLQEETSERSALEPSRCAARYNIIEDDSGKFYLTKNGKKIKINGVCYSSIDNSSFEKGIQYFVQAGGNMLRTYGEENLYNGILDLAHRYGIGVMVGIWVPVSMSEEYSTREKYYSYIERQKRLIDTFKDHPAVVMWSVNNESEGSDRNGEVYAMIEELSRYIKSVDPYHPIATVFAGNGVEKQKKLMALAPSVDILGINTYKAISRSYPSTEESGWKGPIMICEYGPDGTWEAERTSWGVVIEPLNSEKAELYRKRHIENIMTNNKGIGGFAFCLPNAIGFEGTLTWYAFMYKGRRTPIMYEMQYAWTGHYPKTAPPKITKLTVNKKIPSDSVMVLPEEDMYVEANVCPQSDDHLTFSFEIYEEVSKKTKDKSNLECIGKCDNKENMSAVMMKAPKVPGPYRIYAAVFDEHDNVCVDNFPIYVKGGLGSSKDINDISRISDILMKVSAFFEEHNEMDADVAIDITDNINGMIYPAEGKAKLSVSNEQIHIFSRVDYTAGGILSANMIQKTNASEMLLVYKHMALDKDLLKRMRIDTSLDDEYIVIKSQDFIKEFYPQALRGISAEGFMSTSLIPDNIRLDIYISKHSSRVKKAVAVLGYMLSSDEGRHQTIRYIYNYTYGEGVNEEDSK